MAGSNVFLERVHEAARRGQVTLLYSAEDPEHNQAVVLRAHLEQLLAEGPGGN